jgi:hypothetical protein
VGLWRPGTSMPPRPPTRTPRSNAG